MTDTTSAPTDHSPFAPPPPIATTLQPVQRAPYGGRSEVQDVGVDHRRLDVGVAEELLDRSDVRAVGQKMGGEGMAKGVARGALGDVGPSDGIPDGTLGNARIAVVAPLLTGLAFDPAISLREGDSIGAELVSELLSARSLLAKRRLDAMPSGEPLPYILDDGDTN